MCQHSEEVGGYGSSVASFVARHAKLRLAACWEDCPFVSLRYPSSITLEYFWHFFFLAEERRELTNRGVPCRKKGRPKKKKDGKNKEGKPVKTKKRKKIVSILISPLVLFHHYLPILFPFQDSDVDRDSDRERERDFGENSDSLASDYGSGEKKKKKKHKERKEKKTKKKKKDEGDRDSSQEETTKVT